MHDDHTETLRDVAGEPRPHHAGHDHDHGSDLSDVELRVRALETVLVAKGLVDPAALDAIVETYEVKVGPRNGAHVVAHAWSDPAFKARLLEDGAKAIRELGYGGGGGGHIALGGKTARNHHPPGCPLFSLFSPPAARPPPGWVQKAPPPPP